MLKKLISTRKSNENNKQELNCGEKAFNFLIMLDKLMEKSEEGHSERANDVIGKLKLEGIEFSYRAHNNYNYIRNEHGYYSHSLNFEKDGITYEMRANRASRNIKTIDHLWFQPEHSCDSLECARFIKEKNEGGDIVFKAEEKLGSGLLEVFAEVYLKVEEEYERQLECERIQREKFKKTILTPTGSRQII